MHRYTPMLAIALLPLRGFAADVTGPEACARLTTAAERIICYDRLYPPERSVPTPATSTPDSSGTPASATPPTVKPPVAETAPQSAPAMSKPLANDSQSDEAEVQAASATSEQAYRRSYGLFDQPERVNERSTIAAIHRRDSQNMIFLLDNEQIWLQDSARALPFRVGDAVTIKNGTFGGFFLTSDSGTKTRVRRIK